MRELQLSDIIKIDNKIKELEDKIKQNGEEFINLLNNSAKELQGESEGLINIKKSSCVKFSLELGKYEIVIFLMDVYAVPSENMKELEDKNITINMIANNQNYQKYYCGCISFYYIEKGFNEESPIFLQRAFINKDFDIAFQSSNKYIMFQSKDMIIKDLKSILVVMISELFNCIPYYLGTDDIFQIDKSSLVNRKYNSIGFK